MSTRLAGYVSVVTGGASGIGAAVVDRLRGLGSTVYVADVAPVDGEPPIDVTDADSVAAMAERVRAEHGRCDVLVHSAAVVAGGSVDTSAAGADSDWDRVFAVNVRAVWSVSRALLPIMGDGGAIVTIASAAGLRAIPEMAAYVASKAALIGLTRSMALDLAARGIRANCVCPGLVDTPLARGAQALRSSAARASVAQHRGYLVPRAGEVDEIADAVLLMATNGYLTGATLAVDGGRSMH